MTGTPCESCKGGHYVCYCSRRSADGQYVTRYFACWLCGSTGGKTVNPAAKPRRKRRTKDSTKSSALR